VVVIMPDTATRADALLDEVTRLRAQVATLTAERDRLTRALQAPFPTAAELHRQRIWAHLRTITARLVGTAGLLAVAVGLAGGVIRGFS
jgi:anti-sigma factor RsiW